LRFAEEGTQTPLLSQQAVRPTCFEPTEGQSSDASSYFEGQLVLIISASKTH
jgi:hypothetical protein